MVFRFQLEQIEVLIPTLPRNKISRRIFLKNHLQTSPPITETAYAKFWNQRKIVQPVKSLRDGILIFL